MNATSILAILFAALLLGLAGRYFLPDARRRRAHRCRLRAARSNGRIPQQRWPR